MMEYNGFGFHVRLIQRKGILKAHLVPDINSPISLRKNMNGKSWEALEFTQSTHSRCTLSLHFTVNEFRVYYMEFDLLKCWLLFVRSTRHRTHNRVHGLYVTHAYQEANMDKWMNQTYT